MVISADTLLLNMHYEKWSTEYTNLHVLNHTQIYMCWIIQKFTCHVQESHDKKDHWQFQYLKARDYCEGVSVNEVKFKIYFFRHLGLCNIILSILWFCQVIKYCCVWHDDAVRHLGAESMSCSFEHVLFSAGGKLAWSISTEVKEVDWHLESQTKMADSSIRMSSLHLPLLHKVQTKCDSSQEMQVTLALGACVHHRTGHHFTYRGEVRVKHWFLNWPGVLNILLSAMWETARTMQHVDAVHPPWIGLLVVTNRCC